MNFSVTRMLENKIFTTTVKFASYGGFGLTAEEEEALLADFGAPEIDLGAINFTGKLSVGADRRVVMDDSGGEEVSFILNSKKVALNKDFSASYVVDSKKINDTELGSTLKTKELVAEAKCVLFENMLKDAQASAMDILKKKQTTFESGAADYTV